MRDIILGGMGSFAIVVGLIAAIMSVLLYRNPRSDQWLVISALMLIAAAVCLR